MVLGGVWSQSMYRGQMVQERGADCNSLYRREGVGRRRGVGLCCCVKRALCVGVVMERKGLVPPFPFGF